MLLKLPNGKLLNLFNIAGFAPFEDDKPEFAQGAAARPKSTVHYTHGGVGLLDYTVDDILELARDQGLQPPPVSKP